MIKSIHPAMYFRRAALLVATVFLIILLVVVLNSSSINQNLFAVDYTEYWAAAKLVLDGENPFQSEKILEILSGVDWPYEGAINMYNPPWTLGLVLPLGLLPYFTGRLLWFFLSFGAIIFSLDVLWSLYDLPTKKRWLAWILGLSFIPTLQSLDVGQISPLILLGISGFLYFGSSKRWGLAGSSLILISIKPQLLYLFWAILVLWILREKQWRLSAGFIVTGIACLILPILFNPQVLNQYVAEYLGNPPFFFETPLISYTLRTLIDRDRYWLQFVTSAIGLIWGVFYWYRNRSDWSWKQQMPLIILVSFLTSSYAWNHDQIVFLPMIIQAFSWFRSQQIKTIILLAVYIAIDGGMLIAILAGLTQLETIWQPFAWAGFYVLARTMRASQQITTQLSGQIEG